MYKIPAMAQEKAFSLFMWGLELRIWERIGFHAEVDLVQVMARTEKADVWRAKPKGDKNGQQQQKARGNRSGK